jgi:hypothetical protein
VNTKRTLLTLAALAVVALIGAGCGSNAPSETGTPTSSGTAGSSGTRGTKKLAHRDEAVRFAECMRENGVRKFPDPDASGELTIDGAVNGSSLDPSTAAWKAAIGACKDLEPSGFTGHKRSSEQQVAALEFAQCIRENGVKDFPDPAPGQPLVDTNRIPSSAQPGGMSILNAAMHRCGDALAGRLGLTRP